MPEWGRGGQAAAIPFRRSGGCTEVCLVTTSSGARWTVPKGLIEAGDTARTTALKEALEEAGLTGTLGDEAAGRYFYRKWGRMCRVEVFVMAVTGESEVWKERDRRRRLWVDPQEAVRLIGRRPLAEVVRAAVARLDP